MRDNLERVNIVLTKEQHKRFKKYAVRFHGSLSQFIRLAAENEINDEEKMEALYIQPVLKEMNKFNEKLDFTKKSLNSIISHLKVNTSNKKFISEEIIQLLLKHEESLSIPGMLEYLPFQQQDLIEGIEELLDTCSVREIPRPNAPSKWTIIGDRNEKNK